MTRRISVTITALKFPVSGTQNIFSTGNIGRIKNADQLEITFIAAKDGEAFEGLLKRYFG